MRAKLLVGELDLNGLIGAFELNSLRHRLVSRACARRLFVFIHKNNQLTNGGASPTALLRLSLQAFLTDHQFVNEIVSCAAEYGFSTIWWFSASHSSQFVRS